MNTNFKQSSAYELAKLLEVDSWYKLVTREEIANMLRQLANEKAELEKQELNAGGEPVKNATYWKRQHDKLADRIAELEKQNDRLLTIAEDFKLVIEQYKKENAFLKDWRDTWSPYVSQIIQSQTKPLSDEEIEEVINRTAWVGTEDEIRVKIARAIEAKVRGE